MRPPGPHREELSEAEDMRQVWNGRSHRKVLRPEAADQQGEDAGQVLGGVPQVRQQGAHVQGVPEEHHQLSRVRRGSQAGGVPEEQQHAGEHDPDEEGRDERVRQAQAAGGDGGEGAKDGGGERIGVRGVRRRGRGEGFGRRRTDRWDPTPGHPGEAEGDAPVLRGVQGEGQQAGDWRRRGRTRGEARQG